MVQDEIKSSLKFVKLMKEKMKQEIKETMADSSTLIEARRNKVFLKRVILEALEEKEKLVPSLGKTQILGMCQCLELDSFNELYRST